MKKTLFMWILLCLLFPGLYAIEPSRVLKEVDERLTFEDDFSCTFSLELYRAGEKPSLQQVKLFVRPKTDIREEKFLALVIKPNVDRGTGYLGIGDNYWIYDPESRKFQHSSARDNVQDSDVNQDDLGTADYLEDYTVLDMKEDMLGKIPVYVLDLKARKDTVDYEKIRLWVGRENFIPYKEEDYSLSGKLMRTILAPKWTKIENHYIYKKVYFIDELKQGNKTILSFDDISLKPLDDKIFTKSYLERVSK
jgi:outer membrane lipoprotein-sorting protein